MEGLKPALTVSKNWLFRSFLNLFESLLLDEDTMESYLAKQYEAKEKKEIAKKKLAMARSKTRMENEDDESPEKQPLRASVVRQKYFDIVEPREINKIV